MSLEEIVFEHHLKLYKFFDPHRIPAVSWPYKGNTASFSINKSDLVLEFKRDGVGWGFVGNSYRTRLNLIRYDFLSVNKHNWNNEAFWDYILRTKQ